jgi:hypothetical protein
VFHLSFHILAMTTTHLNEHRYSTSDIERDSIVNQVRLSFDSQLSTNVSLLDFSYRDEPAASDSESGILSVHETYQSTIPDPVHLHAPLREKGLELPRGWPTSPQPVKMPIGSMFWYVIVDMALLAVSIAFLAFAWCVVLYDQKPTSFHRQAAERLEQASKWVSAHVVRPQHQSVDQI